MDKGSVHVGLVSCIAPRIDFLLYFILSVVVASSLSERESLIRVVSQDVIKGLMWVNIKMHLMVLPNCVYQGRRHGLQVESHSPLRHCFVFSLSHCVLIKVADHDVPVLEQIQKGAISEQTRASG